MTRGEVDATHGTSGPPAEPTPYTPTTQDIRRMWAEEQDAATDLGYAAHADEFDRWLVALVAEARADERRRALTEAADDYGTPGMVATTSHVQDWLRARAAEVDR